MNLQLSLKKQWFEITDPDGKTEDYRKLTPYWFRRLTNHRNQIFEDDYHAWISFIEITSKGMDGFDSIEDYFSENNVYFKPFTHNIMTLGYPSKEDTSRIKIFEHAGIEIRMGKEEWGAEPNKLYFVIKHGKRIQ